MKINDYKDSVMNHYQTGKERGFEIGFKCLKELITFKPKYTTYIQGFPRAGKTEFHLEILFNLTEKYGWRHALMSPEIGAIEDVIADLISKYLRKPFFKGSYNGASEKEIYSALNHLSEYFFPLDSDKNEYSVDSFYEDCKKLQKDNKVTINTTSIDPWNDLEEDLSKYGGREDKYLAAALRKVRSSAKINGWHNFIVTHSKDMEPITLKSTEGGTVSCTAIPTLQSFAGGQVWSRRGFNVIGLWKPEKTAINPKTSLPFFDNEVMIKILKAKPKGVGQLGQAYMFFDWKTNRYYEHFCDKSCYAWDYLKFEPQIQESIF